MHNLQLFIQNCFNLKETYVKTHWWKATQLQWVQLFSCKIQLSEDACWMFAHKIDICSYSYMQVQLAWRCIFKAFPQKRGLTPMLKNPTQNIWSVAEVLAFYENKLTTKRWQTIAIVIAIHETTSTGWDIIYFIFSSFVIVLEKLGITSSFKKNMKHKKVQTITDFFLLNYCNGIHSLGPRHSLNDHIIRKKCINNIIIGVGNPDD